MKNEIWVNIKKMKVMKTYGRDEMTCNVDKCELKQ